MEHLLLQYIRSFGFYTHKTKQKNNNNNTHSINSGIQRYYENKEEGEKGNKNKNNNHKTPFFQFLKSKKKKTHS